jgi:hypothetical protein
MHSPGITIPMLGAIEKIATGRNGIDARKHRPVSLKHLAGQSSACHVLLPVAKSTNKAFPLSQLRDHSGCRQRFHGQTLAFII